LEEVINMEDFNSEADDYNSDLPQNRFGEFALTFSSNREEGAKFQLQSFHVSFGFNEKKKTVYPEIYKPQSGKWPDHGEIYEEVGLANKTDGDFNVLGPAFYGSMFFNRYSIDSLSQVLFYADDSEGNLEIKYVYFKNNRFEGLFKFDLLNSPFDDAYPSINADGTSVLFCSNRDGDFDIYEAKISQPNQDKNITLESIVNPSNVVIKKRDDLNSPMDDKCPSYAGIGNNTIMFVSNRKGGSGGFDIYYSENGKIPQNAGNRINTIYDEYRPIVPSLGYFNYYPMIFSSNRPGGKGGFDLYMTGLKDVSWNN
jgi:hypothetical protein